MLESISHTLQERQRRRRAAPGLRTLTCRGASLVAHAPLRLPAPGASEPPLPPPQAPVLQALPRDPVHCSLLCGAPPHPLRLPVSPLVSSPPSLSRRNTITSPPFLIRSSSSSATRPPRFKSSSRSRRSSRTGPSGPPGPSRRRRRSSRGSKASSSRRGTTPSAATASAPRRRSSRLSARTRPPHPPSPANQATDDDARLTRLKPPPPPPHTHTPAQAPSAAWRTAGRTATSSCPQ